MFSALHLSERRAEAGGLSLGDPSKMAVGSTSATLPGTYCAAYPTRRSARKTFFITSMASSIRRNTRRGSRRFDEDVPRAFPWRRIFGVSQAGHKLAEASELRNANRIVKEQRDELSWTSRNFTGEKWRFGKTARKWTRPKSNTTATSRSPAFRWPPTITSFNGSQPSRDHGPLPTAGQGQPDCDENDWARKKEIHPEPAQKHHHRHLDTMKIVNALPAAKGREINQAVDREQAAENP